MGKAGFNRMTKEAGCVNFTLKLQLRDETKRIYQNSRRCDDESSKRYTAELRRPLQDGSPTLTQLPLHASGRGNDKQNDKGPGILRTGCEPGRHCSEIEPASRL